jgi:hypothetical protein
VRIRVVREPSIDGATLSVWFVDGHYECFGLEDELRDMKVPGATAIPAGEYAVVVTPSVRFRRPLPLLVDVPGFSGIRIHPGNTIEDTAGCLLPGRVRAAAGVGESRHAFDQLFQKVQVAIARGERVTCRLENPQL